jgi:hypothetical protein
MRLLVSGLVAALVALSTATPAVAGDYVHTDGAGDMYRVLNRDASAPAPDQVEGDISRVQIKHNRRYVQLFMTVREAKRETLNTFFFFTLQNGRKQVTDVTVGTYPAQGFPDGVLTIKDGRTHRDKRCRGLKGFKISWDTNLVAVTIPRTCVKRPKYLRVQAVSAVDYDTTQDFIDDGQSAGNPDTHTAWSPWVRRG